MDRTSKPAPGLYSNGNSHSNSNNNGNSNKRSGSSNRSGSTSSRGNTGAASQRRDNHRSPSRDHSVSGRHTQGNQEATPATAGLRRDASPLKGENPEMGSTFDAQEGLWRPPEERLGWAHLGGDDPDWDAPIAPAFRRCTSQRRPGPHDPTHPSWLDAAGAPVVYPGASLRCRGPRLRRRRGLRGGGRGGGGDGSCCSFCW